MTQSLPKKNLSLSPLTFEEAVTGILKIKAMPKAPKKKPKGGSKIKE
jgi:hypothetical protein